MKQGGDWAGYDRHFRKLRETNSNILWGTMVLDLQLHYSRHNYQRVSHTKQHNSFSNKRPDYCYRYNTQGQICKIPACRYKHICNICKGTHPSYTCTLRLHGRASIVSPGAHTSIRDSNRQGIQQHQQKTYHSKPDVSSHK